LVLQAITARAAELGQKRDDRMARVIANEILRGLSRMFK
jgi:hypothetical protein